MRREYDFSKGKRGAVVAADGGKTRITIRLDNEILDWFREQVNEAGGGNYQTMINNALREYTQERREPIEKKLRRVIREELKKIGVTVDVVTLDSTQVVERFLSGHYDAVYYNATKTDLDPGTNQDFWLSSGGAHPWNIEQKTPATDWERRIDELMLRQTASRDEAERKRLYDDVQKIFCDHLPIVFFVAPRIYAASSARVLNVTPSDARPQLLWRPEVVAVVH